MTPFSVVLIPFPFADLTSSKQRPGLVLSSYKTKSLGEFLVICMITSNLDSLEFPFDYRIKDIDHAGLPKESIVRISKVVTIEKKLVKKQLGTLGASDIKNVKLNFKRLFKEL